MRLRTGLLVLSLVTFLVAADIASAAFPGRNGRIAFVRNGDIYTVRPDGSRLRHVTSGPPSDGHPAWSANGRWIVFDRGRSPSCDGFQMIYRIRPNGSRLQRLSPPEGETCSLWNTGDDPAWTSDGRIVFTRRNPGFEDGQSLYVMDSNGGNAQSLTPIHTSEFAVDMHAAWAPRRALFAYVTQDDIGPGFLYIQSEDGSFSRQVDAGPMHIYEGNVSPSWDPHGGRVVFERHRCVDLYCEEDWSSELSMFTISSGAVAPVVTGPGDASTPVWSPNGRRIAFERGGSIYKVGLKSGRVRFVVAGVDRHGALSGAQFDWQPVAR